jgi:hypothetical protein
MLVYVAYGSKGEILRGEQMFFRFVLSALPGFQDSGVGGSSWETGLAGSSDPDAFLVRRCFS